MKIKDITKIKGREVITIKPNVNLPEAIKKLVNHQIGAMPVCDFKGKLVGIFSERDVLKWIHKGKKWAERTRRFRTLHFFNYVDDLGRLGAFQRIPDTQGREGSFSYTGHIPAGRASRPRFIFPKKLSEGYGTANGAK